MADLAQLEPLQHVIDRHIKLALDTCGGSVGKAAKAIGTGRATLYRWLAGRRVCGGPNRDALSVQERRFVRLTSLRDAQEAWRTCQNVGAFTRWLDEQIKEAGGAHG